MVFNWLTLSDVKRFYSMPTSRSQFYQAISLKVKSQPNWNTTSLATVTDCYLSFLRATTSVTSTLDSSDGVKDFFLHTSKDSSIDLPKGLLTICTTSTGQSTHSAYART